MIPLRNNPTTSSRIHCVAKKDRMDNAAMCNVYFAYNKKNPVNGCSKECLYKTIGSTQNVVEAMLKIVPMKIPVTLQKRENTIDATIFTAACINVTYRSK